MLWLWRKAEKKDAERAAQAALYAQPPVLNPAAHEQLAFAEWRAGHIARWLAENPDEPAERRNFLEAERDMYLAILRQHGKDV